MSIFVDTSAVYAFFDASDKNHKSANAQWTALLQTPESLITSNYVVVETHSLLQARFGINASQDFHSQILPLISIELVDMSLHAAGVQAVFAANKRNLSLVDCVSFAVMRRQGIKRVFTFDQHFKDQGFECLP